MGESFCLLEWKEIENYIPQNMIIETAKKRWDTFNKSDGGFDPSSISDKAFELKTVGIGKELEKFVERSDAVKPSRKFFGGYRYSDGLFINDTYFCLEYKKAATEVAANKINIDRYCFPS